MENTAKKMGKINVTYALIMALASAGFRPGSCHSEQNKLGKAS